MRLKIRSLRRTVKGNLPIEFVDQHFTSYGGLELLARFFRTLDVASRLRRALAAIPSDSGSERLARCWCSRSSTSVRGAGDPLIARFCGLARMPTPRTVSHWRTRFTQATLAPLVELNAPPGVTSSGFLTIRRSTGSTLVLHKPSSPDHLLEQGPS